MDRARLQGWADLMRNWGMRPPPEVNRALANRTGPARGAGVGDSFNQQGFQRAREQFQDRRETLRERANPPFRFTTPAESEAEYNARVSAAYGGQTPANAPVQSYQNYANSDDYARAPGRVGGRAEPFTVPTQINGVPNIIPAGARIFYAEDELAGQPAPPRNRVPQRVIGNAPRRREF